ncbi:MAG: GNAT family N-acetyltransferase [Pyrinomonadaceae bacterium]
MGIEIKRVDTDSKDLIALIAKLDRELAVRDGDEHSFFQQFNKLDPEMRTLVAYLDGDPVGCGAFRAYGEDRVEIKRMFVDESARNRRIGALILGELEVWANEEGFSTAILETGIRQPEAIRLYEREGYKRIPNFGQYAGVESSVCFEKQLGKTDDAPKGHAA